MRQLERAFLIEATSGIFNNYYTRIVHCYHHKNTCCFKMAIVFLSKSFCGKINMYVLQINTEPGLNIKMCIHRPIYVSEATHLCLSAVIELVYVCASTHTSQQTCM